MKHCGTKRLETQRLILRRFTMQDAAAMFLNWATDENVTKYLSWPPHANVGVTEAVLKIWVDAYEKKDFYQWAIVLKSNGDAPIGSICAVWLNERTDAVDIGYCIGSRWWHQGVMSEALQAVIDFFFDEVEANRIEADHDVNNPHSGMVMRHCGMRYEGTMRSAGRNNQGLCDLCRYAILKTDR
ncbi:MAG: GNAT family N-acetyltransferase [Clostridia bacterium]|nr:GNAT family N-acetyltransferase [Clostridia bacterium]